MLGRPQRSPVRRPQAVREQGRLTLRLKCETTLAGTTPTGVGPVRHEPQVSDQRQDGPGGGCGVRARATRVRATRAEDARTPGRLSCGTRRCRRERRATAPGDH